MSQRRAEESAWKLCDGDDAGCSPTSQSLVQEFGAQSLLADLCRQLIRRISHQPHGVLGEDGRRWFDPRKAGRIETPALLKQEAGLPPAEKWRDVQNPCDAPREG